MHCQLPVGYRLGVLIVRREALDWADFDTKVADATFEPVYRPFPALLADTDGIGRAPSATETAEDASVDSIVNLSTGNRRESPGPLGVHEGRGPFDQVPHYSFRHRKYFHFTALTVPCN